MTEKTLENLSGQEKRGAMWGLPTYNFGPGEAEEEL